MPNSKPQKERALVIGLYYHPEAYPPTLNAVRELSKVFDRIVIVHRPHIKGNWEYPSNVTTVPSGKPLSPVEQEQAPTSKKVGFFLQFVRDFYKQCKLHKPDVILLYDTVPMLVYRIIRAWLNFKHKLWYHSHDIAEIDKARKYSIGWFAIKAERKMFKHIDLFTLPAESRLKFFKMDELKGEYIVVPNYPARFVYDPYYKVKKLDSPIKIIFQGRINNGHGFEHLIQILKTQIAGRKLELLLKGYCEESYKSFLLALAKEHNVSDSLQFVGFGPYKEVPQVSSGCHIGIGIFSEKEIMHLTLGTSSNKLYEYAALGLPVIYSREKHFTDYLGRYDWAVDVEDSKDSIREGILRIIESYDRLSSSARKSFSESLNFEEQFKPVLAWLAKNN